MNKIDFAVGIGGENGQGIASTGDILARIFARDCGRPARIRSHWLFARLRRYQTGG